MTCLRLTTTRRGTEPQTYRLPYYPETQGTWGTWGTWVSLGSRLTPYFLTYLYPLMREVWPGAGDARSPANRSRQDDTPRSAVRNAHPTPSANLSISSGDPNESRGPSKSLRTGRRLSPTGLPETGCQERGR